MFLREPVHNRRTGSEVGSKLNGGFICGSQQVCLRLDLILEGYKLKQSPFLLSTVEEMSSSLVGECRDRSDPVRLFALNVNVFQRVLWGPAV